MPWLRTGDNSATHPIVMRVHEISEDPRSVNEVFGFVVRCALQSAAHVTDYEVDLGTAFMIGLGETERLLDLAQRAGYLREHKRAGRRVWKIVDDPEFLHMRKRSEIEWEKQQRADNANPALIVPVRRRDGDQCRYCSTIVNWKARKGKLAGTYDHREPGHAGTVETLVVACGACNAGRRDRADADDSYPLRPPPPSPYFSAASAMWLAERGHPVAPASPKSADRSADRPSKRGAQSADPAEALPSGSGFAGSGRVGSGRVGSGRVGSTRRQTDSPQAIHDVEERTIS